MNYRIGDISYKFNFFLISLCFYLVKVNKILIWEKKKKGQSVFQARCNYTHAKIGIREEQCIISFFLYVRQIAPVSTKYYAIKNILCKQHYC